MEIVGIGEVWIQRSARDILETALNPRKYALEDRKMGPVLAYERDGSRGSMLACGRLYGIPVPPLRLRFELTPYSHLALQSTASRAFRFCAEFTCRESGQGTWIQHI